MRQSGCGIPPLRGCFAAAFVLPMLRGNLERLLNGPTLDSPEPERSSDAASRLRIAQAVRRAEFAIAWERSWPHLARFLTVAGLFLVLSWAGLWLVLPFAARAVGLGIFLAVALAALFPLFQFRWPSRQDALTRLDRGTGIRHRPATSLTDTLTTQDPVALALWQAPGERTPASIKRIRAGLPSPRLAIHDPWALRALIVVLMVATYIAAGDERRIRIAAAFDWNGVFAAENIRVDAWVTPPLYTGKPPIILSAANKEAALPPSGPLAVPAGSTLIVRSSGGTLDVVTGGGVGQTVKDLSEDPYAGADVTLTLTAKDQAGNEGRSEPFDMRLPERLFTKPMARALIEQRRALALDANQRPQVNEALDALMIAPELFMPDTGHYLGLRSVAREIELARTDATMREAGASLGALPA